MHILVIISNPNVMISYSHLSNAYAMFDTSMKLFWGIFSKGINDTNEIILWDSSNERMRAQWFTQFFGSNTRTSCCQKGPKRSTTKPTLPNSWKRRFISSHFRWIDLHYFHSLLITSTFLLNSHPLLSAHSFIHSFIPLLLFLLHLHHKGKWGSAAQTQKTTLQCFGGWCWLWFWLCCWWCSVHPIPEGRSLFVSAVDFSLEKTSQV